MDIYQIKLKFYTTTQALIKKLDKKKTFIWIFRKIISSSLHNSFTITRNLSKYLRRILISLSLTLFTK